MGRSESPRRPGDYPAGPEVCPAPSRAARGHAAWLLGAVYAAVSGIDAMRSLRRAAHLVALQGDRTGGSGGFLDRLSIIG